MAITTTNIYQKVFAKKLTCIENFILITGA